MAKISFEQAEQHDTALAVREEKPLAHYMDGEVDRSDLVTPTLNIVAKVGDLSNQFSSGSIVLDKRLELVKRDQPLDVIALSIAKSYQEDTVFGEELGDRANTLAEVRTKGGQIEDREGDNFWTPIARIIFLVKKTDGIPAEADPFFYQEIGEDKYLLAQLYARKSAYTSVAKPLFTLKAMQGSVSKLAYKLTSSLHTFNGNSWFRPNLRPDGKPSAEVAAFLAGVNM